MRWSCLPIRPGPKLRDSSLHPGVHNARVDACGDYVVGRSFEGEDAGELVEGSLGGAVGGHTGQRVPRGGARDVHDTSPVLGGHLRQRLSSQQKVPVTLTSKTRRHCAASMAATGSGTPGVPALLTRMVMGPSSARALSKPEATESSSETSTTSGGRSAQGFDLCRNGDDLLLGARGEATAAPRLARSLAVAAPIPRPPPVIGAAARVYPLVHATIIPGAEIRRIVR